MMDPAAWLAMVSSGWSEMGSTQFWVALVKIMWINVLLSGDNALVIAMAWQGLPQRQRLWGMILGAGVAVLLRSALRRRRRHHHDPGRCHRHCSGGWRQHGAGGARRGHQYPLDRGRRRADHGAARPFPDSGMGGGRPARLDRRRA